MEISSVLCDLELFIYIFFTSGGHKLICFSDIYCYYSYESVLYTLDHAFFPAHLVS